MKNLTFTDEELLILSKYATSTSVAELLQKFGGDIDKLKAYIKWLYKYGGTGSKGGSGGGGGNAGAQWSLSASLNEDKITKEILPLIKSSNNKYNLSIRIARPGTDTYSVNISYLEDGSTKPVKYNTQTLSSEKSSVDLVIDIKNNGKLTITAVNNFDGTDAVIQTSCIIDHADFSISFVDNNDNNYNFQNDTVYFNNLSATRGLKLKVIHDIKISGTENNIIHTTVIGNINYQVEDITLGNFGVNENTNKKYSYIDLYELLNLGDNSITADDIAGTYNITSTLVYNYNGRDIPYTKKISLTIIPEGLYVKVIPLIDNAQIYRSAQSEDQYLFNTSHIPLSITAYSNKNETLTIEIIKQSTGSVDFRKAVSNRGVLTSAINLTPSLTEITEHIFTFRISTVTNEYKEYTYYIYLNKESSGLSWYPAYIESAIISDSHSYFRKNDALNFDTTKLLQLNNNWGSNGYVPFNVVSMKSDDLNVVNKLNLYEDNNDTSLSTMMISVGIQYNIVNNSTEILRFVFGSGNAIKTISLYQNKMIYMDNADGAQEIFIPSTTSYNPENLLQYHLLNIVIRKISNINQITSTENCYELIIYVDGCIEQVLNTYFITQSESNYTAYALNKIEAFEGNYALNLVEITYFNETQLANDNLDAVVSQYWAKYQNELYTNESQENFDEIKTFLNTIAPIFKEEDIYLNNALNTFITVELSALSEDIVMNTLFTNNYHYGVPMMILHFDLGKYTQDDVNSFLVNNFIKYYKEGTLDKQTYDVTQIIWIDENNNYKSIDSVQFLFNLQGSSTGQFKSKNFDLTAVQKNTGYTVLWTPNYSPTSTVKNLYDETINTSYLPENSYTFKADAVDSTHANNTSIGMFVNKNTHKFAAASTSQGANSLVYSQYIKNCLVGFPVIVLFAFTINKEEENNDGTISTYSELKTYFMGIYNFNLGRKSYMNLGYYNIEDVLTNLKDIDNVDQSVSLQPGFNVYQIASNYYQPISYLSVAEIQGGQNYYDFSQFDSSILFGTNNTEGMFGDFYPDRATDIAYSQTKIQNFVKAVSIYGGGIFTQLGKNMSTNDAADDKYGYISGYQAYRIANGLHYITHSINQVPNYRYQFIAQYNAAENKIEYVYNNHLELDQMMDPFAVESTFDVGFASFIGIPEVEDTGDGNQHPYDRNQPHNINDYLLDYRSLVEYYTICMAFGLVDSVLKNLNIKAFGDASPYYIAFYDMDTANGRDNGGKYTSPFAFSDFWITQNNNNIIYRDFFPEIKLASDTSSEASHHIGDPDDVNKMANIRGYDVPSSYLFAIAKYAKVFIKQNSPDYYDTNPNYYWYRLRHDENSPLANSSKFINEYFANNLNKINSVVWNMNYRFKYFRKEANNYGTTDLSAFHGRGVACLEDWLNKRLHVLDAYFNIQQDNQPIQVYDIATDTWSSLIRNGNPVIMPSLSSVIGDNVDSANNPDIQLNQSMFGGDGDKYTSSRVSATIRALDYSPMYFTIAGKQFSFICIDKNEEYNFNANVINEGGVGQLTMSFGGSVAWTYVNNLNNFIESGSLTIKSDYLENINITNGNLSTLNLNNIISVKTISITSPYATCTLDLSNTTSEDKYPNLRTVDLHNTKCGFTANNINVTNIYLDNMLSGNRQINIQNCLNIQNITLNNSSFQSFTCNPMWGPEAQTGITQFGMKYKNIPIRLVELSNTAIVDSLSLVNDLYDNLGIIISNDYFIKTISLTGFSYIIIEKCPNVTSINITDNKYKVKSLSIKHCYPIMLESGVPLDYKEGRIKVTCNSSAATDLAHIDVSSLTGLESVSFEGTWQIEDITLPNNAEIILLDRAFNKVNIKYINFKDHISANHYLALEQTSSDCGIFEDSCFTLCGKNPNNVSDPDDDSIYSLQFKVANDCTQLRRLFMINQEKVQNAKYEATPSIDYFTCKQFIDNLENSSHLTDLSYMFYGQIKIKTTIQDSTVINESGTSIKNNIFTLANYTNVTNISNMFALTNMHYISKKMFTNDSSSVGGNKMINVLNFIVPVNTTDLIYVTEDAYSSLYNRYTTFFAKVNVSEMDQKNKNIYNLCIVDNNSIILDTVVLRDLFVPEDQTSFPSNLTELVGFNICNAIVDMKDMFDSDVSTNIQTINYCLTEFKDTNDILNINSINLDKQDNLIVLYKAFEFKNNINNRIDIAHFINLSKLDTIYSNGYGSEDNTAIIFNFYKKLDYDTDWNNIWDAIKGFRKIDYLFNRCNFKSSTTNTLVVPNNITISAESAQYLFSESTFIDENDHNKGIKLSNNSIKGLTKLTNASYMFKQATLDNTEAYPIPDDLFTGMTTLTNVKGMFRQVKFISDNGWRTYYDAELAKKCYYVWNASAGTETNFESPHNYELLDQRAISIKNTPIWNKDFSYYPILPPSLFVGTNITNASEFIYSSPFEGYLPLLFTNTSISNISDMLFNCKVLPQLYESISLNDGQTYRDYIYAPKLQTANPNIYLYTFIPSNYIAATVRNISGLCNFKMFVGFNIDSSNSTDIPRIYLIVNDFATHTNITECKGTSPQLYTIPESGLTYEANRTLLNEINICNKITYDDNDSLTEQLIYNSDIIINGIINKYVDNGTVTYKEGFDIEQTYYNMITNNNYFISPEMASVYYGYLFIKNTNIESPLINSIIKIYDKSHYNNSAERVLQMSTNMILPHINIIQTPYEQLTNYIPTTESYNKQNPNYCTKIMTFNSSSPSAEITINESQIDNVGTENNNRFNDLMQYILLFNSWYSTTLDEIHYTLTTVNKVDIYISENKSLIPLTNTTIGGEFKRSYNYVIYVDDDGHIDHIDGPL